MAKQGHCDYKSAAGLRAGLVVAMLNCLMTGSMWSLPSERENEEHPWSESQGCSPEPNHEIFSQVSHRLIR